MGSKGPDRTRTREGRIGILGAGSDSRARIGLGRSGSDIGGLDPPSGASPASLKPVCYRGTRGCCASSVAPSGGGSTGNHGTLKKRPKKFQRGRPLSCRGPLKDPWTTGAPPTPYAKEIHPASQNPPPKLLGRMEPPALQDPVRRPGWCANRAAADPSRPGRYARASPLPLVPCTLGNSMPGAR